MLAKKQRRLEGHSRRLFGAPRTARRRAVDLSDKLDLDLVEAEHCGRPCGMPFGGQCRGEAVVLNLIGAAIGNETVAARDLAIRQMHDSGAFAARSPEPCRISTVSEHDTTLRGKS